MGAMNGETDSNDFLVVFHAASAGLNGSLLGSDEEEIVFLVFLIYDVRNNKVCSLSTIFRIIAINFNIVSCMERA